MQARPDIPVSLFRTLIASCVYLALLLTGLLPREAVAQNITRVSLESPPRNADEEHIEATINAFMAAINNAYYDQEPLELDGIATPDGKERILALWNNNSQFYCVEPEITTQLLKSRNGYQVREIPLFQKRGKDAGDPQKREGVLHLDSEGNIIDFVFGVDIQRSDLIGSIADTLEVRRKTIILDFVENFRTAYERKDIPFLESIFSDDALIIVGRVIKVEETDHAGTSIASSYEDYTIQEKHEYLANLSKAFEKNEFINVGFDDIGIVKHPSHPSIYGVTLFQDWVSSTYQDAGFLFLMIDFTNEENPMIHVRTWQAKLNTQKENAFQLSDFWIERN